jgi:hypothetical protein
MERIRLTAKIAAAEKAAENKKDTARKGELSRNIDGFDYDPSKATVLKKALHNINVSLGTLISAMKELSILRGSEITPDGMLGGRGFIMPFREIKMKINAAITDLSDVTDTVADELTNPKWGLSDLDRKKVKQETENIDEKVEEVEEVAPGDTAAPDVEGVPSETVDKPPLEEINPEDVKDSFEVEALRRYGDLLGGNVKDKVAAVLSRNIMANLSKGDR